MKLILDTHTFIWWDSEATKLSTRVLELCQDVKHTLILSVASVWEMQIKLQLGKLKFSLPLTDIIESQRLHNRILILPVDLRHVLVLSELPSIHKDPFDRLLIAQAKCENAVIITADPVFANYAVPVEW